MILLHFLVLLCKKIKYTHKNRSTKTYFNFGIRQSIIIRENATNITKLISLSESLSNNSAVIDVGYLILVNRTRPLRSQFIKWAGLCPILYSLHVSKIIRVN